MSTGGRDLGPVTTGDGVNDSPAAEDESLDPSGDRWDDQVVLISEPVRRYVQAHTRQPADTDDVVQETLTRVLEHGRGLAVDSALAYALVTARHVLADRANESDRNRRHAHRMLDLSRSASPDDQVLDEEERRALRQALGDLPVGQQRLLLAHVLEARPVSEIAAEEGRSDGALAAQLARVRARVRLDYVLALRGISLPTSRCRPILLALSAGDVRRQATLRAGHHLLTCPTCADVAEPLLRRRRALVAVLPWIGAGPWGGLLRRLWTRRPVQVASGTAVVAVVAGSALIWGPSSAPTTRAGARHPQSLTTSSTPLVSPPVPVSSRQSGTSGPTGELVRVRDDRPVRARSGDLRSLGGRAVTGRSMRVLAVPADEGFWISNTDGDRVWVQLHTRGRESGVNVNAGDRVSFTGHVQVDDKHFAAHVGVTPKEGAALLTKEGAHVEVSVAELTVRHQ